jgi:hypothetical protein
MLMPKLCARSAAASLGKYLVNWELASKALAFIAPTPDPPEKQNPGPVRVNPARANPSAAGGPRGAEHHWNPRRHPTLPECLRRTFLGIQTTAAVFWQLQSPAL